MDFGCHLLLVDMTDKGYADIAPIQISTEPAILNAFLISQILVYLVSIKSILLIIFENQRSPKSPLNERLDNLHLNFNARREKEDESEYY